MGLYCGDVGEYCGLVGLYCGLQEKGAGADACSAMCRSDSAAKKPIMLIASQQQSSQPCKLTRWASTAVTWGCTAACSREWMGKAQWQVVSGCEAQECIASGIPTRYSRGGTVLRARRRVLWACWAVLRPAKKKEQRRGSPAVPWCVSRRYRCQAPTNAWPAQHHSRGGAVSRACWPAMNRQAAMAQLSSCQLSRELEQFQPKHAPALGATRPPGGFQLLPTAATLTSRPACKNRAEGGSEVSRCGDTVRSASNERCLAKCARNQGSCGTTHEVGL